MKPLKPQALKSIDMGLGALGMTAAMGALETNADELLDMPDLELQELGGKTGSRILLERVSRQARFMGMTDAEIAEATKAPECPECGGKCSTGVGPDGHTPVPCEGCFSHEAT